MFRRPCPACQARDTLGGVREPRPHHVCHARNRRADPPGGSRRGGSCWRSGASVCLMDFVYEGARSVTGPLLAHLGASAAVVGVVTGAGEAAALGLRLASGPLADRSRRFWTWTIAGYVLTAATVPVLGLTGVLWAACTLVIAERVGKAVRSPPRTHCSRTPPPPPGGAATSRSTRRWTRSAFLSARSRCPGPRPHRRRLRSGARGARAARRGRRCAAALVACQGSRSDRLGDHHRRGGARGALRDRPARGSGR